MTSKARNNRFQFQQFAIDQVEHGMRISEDAVIFGAWIELEPGTTMDVGCGTGLLSLMLAQRYPEALITGVELDKEAALLAERNFKKSPFDNRLKLVHSDIFELDVPSVNNLVCNPPFFIGGTKSGQQQRAQARTDEFMPLQSLWEKTIAIAKPKQVQLLIPSNRESECFQSSQQQGYSLKRWTRIAAKPSKEPHCSMLTFCANAEQSTGISPEVLFVRNQESDYAQEYLSLVNGFYLRK